MTANNKLPVLDLVSAQMQAVLTKSAELVPDAYATDVGLAEIRDAYTRERSFWNEGGPTMERTIDDVVDTPHATVAVRCHIPTGADLPPTVMYIHGGGFVVGNLDTHDRIMRMLAQASGAAVVGIDYTLSPEAKFPVALEQCAAVARHLRRHGKEYGIDATNLAFAGDSGGATLSLGAALWLRDKFPDEPPLTGLVLYYGLYGLRDSASRRLLGGPWDGLTQQDLDYYMREYLADPSDLRNPYNDLLSADLSYGLPAVYLAAAELDPLRDDSAALAAVLDMHQVPLEYEVFPGVLHAFLHNSRLLDAASQALEHGGCFLRRVFDKNKQGESNGLQTNRRAATAGR